MLDKLSKLFLLAVATVLVTAVLTTGPSDPVWAKKKDSGDGGTGGNPSGPRSPARRDQLNASDRALTPG